MGLGLPREVCTILINSSGHIVSMCIWARLGLLSSLFNVTGFLLYSCSEQQKHFKLATLAY